MDGPDVDIRRIRKLVAGTSDSAFAIDSSGLIVAWNPAAEALFGPGVEHSIGKPCGDIVQGTDECGPVCSKDCTIQQAVHDRRLLSNFDLQVQTVNGRQWCNVSVLIVDNGDSESRYSIHIFRPIDFRKQLELLVRDFVSIKTNLPSDQTAAMIPSTRAAARNVSLTSRELEVLRLLARGTTTANIAAQLQISHTTTNNHIQHILGKLNAHSRLEAIRRAEHAGLI